MPVPSCRYSEANLPRYRAKRHAEAERRERFARGIVSLERFEKGGVVGEDTSRVRVRVHGRVQGVFFRAATRDVARSLGLAGTVRNLADGGVEAIFEGAPAAIAAAIAWCESGPDRADVTQMECSDEAPTGLHGFTIIG